MSCSVLSKLSDDTNEGVGVLVLEYSVDEFILSLETNCVLVEGDMISNIYMFWIVYCSVFVLRPESC